ncbi:hypothetical protein [Pseudomonas sp. UW4]|uniref:hypothetical protein n=1 Tax=Pseudomonas sp. UW4 TaxID=1207075 RepID=UPI00029CE0CD|nr:hypothetical protein [Pseudomonas sp. UW4]AFY20774.1 hypothetical protein PputUW4_03582 [Pseudomonas sp. UW4]
MNYISIHKPSSLIINVITSSKAPTPDSEHSFHSASEMMLKKYYQLKSKANSKGVLVSAGDLAAVSPSFLESLVDKHKK